jgi:type IV pilus assembly protein PilW
MNFDMSRHSKRAQFGFTLVELMVSIALGLIVLLALSVLFLRNTNNQSELERGLLQAENARFALDVLAEDVMHAGYYSDFSPNSLPTPPSYQLGTACPTGIAGLAWNTTVSPVQMPVPLLGVSATQVLACATSRRANTEALVVRHADNGPTVALATATAGNLYMQVARCTKDVDRVHASDELDATKFPARMPDCLTRNDAIRRFVQRTYYIGTCSNCAGSGDGIPTLRRTEWIDGALRDLPIAEGVENLQVEYGLDTNNDGTPDSFGTHGSVTSVTPATWDNVIAVRIHLLTRATERTNGYVESRSFRLGPDVTINASSLTDGFKRTLHTTTVRLPNVAGRRE